MKIIRYDHTFSNEKTMNVAVFEDLKGRHKEHCLCFSCGKFQPGTSENCEIAQATFENCVKYNTVTPMWECAEFVKV